VSIVDADRIWFAASHGLDVDEVGRDPGLCASAILQDDPYLITDAGTDPRCLDNPLVRGDLGVRFYLGAQIRTHDGHNLGTVNVIAGRPRAVTQPEVDALAHLADVVAHELETRLTARRLAAAADREIARLRDEALHLQVALDSRVIIEQAKGVLVERHGEDPDTAFARLRAHARSHRRGIHDVADDIVRGRVDV
jgi:GAF domain-containing protein